MERKKIVLALMFIFIANMSAAQTGGGGKQGQTEPVAASLGGFKKVLSFGDENLPSEYLLASPQTIAVNDKNDIYVFDESRLKVYDSSGKPKKIIGGPGQGPGEFSAGISSLIISPTGFISVCDGSRINIFNSNNMFVKKPNLTFDKIFTEFLNKNGLENSNVSEIVALDENRLIIRSYFVKSSASEPSIGVWSLIYLTDKEAKLLVKKETLWSNGYGKRLFYWSFINDNIIVCTAAEFGENKNSLKNTKPEYTLTLVDIANPQVVEIKRIYQPVSFSDSVKEKLNNSIKSSNNIKNIAPNKEYFDTINSFILADEQILKYGYHPPIQNLKTDGTLIFAFTQQTNKEGQILTDIFDAQTKEYKTSVYFPFIPTVIKNSYAYKFNNYRNDKSLYPQVEKYAVDPKVYKK
jgi:hypothetical protein